MKRSSSIIVRALGVIAILSLAMVSASATGAHSGPPRSLGADFDGIPSAGDQVGGVYDGAPQRLYATLRIEPPLPRARAALKANLEYLPRGARAHLPAFDGDRFFVTFPVRQSATVSASSVRAAFVLPLLRALGASQTHLTVGSPPTSGVKEPVANFHKLAQIVAYEYANNPRLLRPKTERMLAVFLGRAKPDEQINNALQMGEGMSYAQFVAGIERQRFDYFFAQVVGSTPVEHSGIMATRWEGQNITEIRGVVFQHYQLMNAKKIPPTAAFALAFKALSHTKGIRQVSRRELREAPALVLLPYGNGAGSSIGLRYAYRMTLTALAQGQRSNTGFQLWLDATTGRILKLEPELDEVTGAGAVYNRDPGVGTTTTSLEVNPSSGGQYTLQLAGVMNRVDYQADGYNASDVSISDSANGSSSAFANFNQAPLNDASQALCASGTNKAFEQVNFYGTIYRYYETVLGQGIYTPFPATPWSPLVDNPAQFGADSSMNYGSGPGYTNAACPNFSDTTFGQNNFMNFAHDNTVIGHELAHSITPRLANARPADWCGVPGCAIPTGWSNFHDLADFWADHFESTNCTAGWVAKNLGGVNFSLNCAHSVENGWLPRQHIVTVPFNPASPGDHFPEHRNGGNICDYCNGQIGAAALWQIRIGMRSKCRPSGLPQFGVRFQRALKQTGFLGFAPPNADLGIYQQLYDLALEMTDEWATSGSPGGPPAFAHNGPHTTNKVTAGFARTGTFLIPYQCLDRNNGTSDPLSCPGGESGADAVIDIDDNDLSNDITINGVTHPTYDFLKAGGVAPTFHVWTGVAYTFDATGKAGLVNPAPCNTQFSVDVANDPSFPVGMTISSPWTSVNTNPTSATPECFGDWTPTAAQWTTLQAGGNRIYYRVTTKDAGGGSVRVSTSPGAGLWTVPPPYAVITLDGKSDY